ncbi:hypothetical protein BGZ95_011490 [Linnemannia exigua]|uniref:C2H2-type domain-containing protein n=1 Tax=Linnemannia exigua TaxID=604196 RepID=A0AAD4DAC2_9FUNG|nr:hypothetical protein BGZ95_011490 [Linnemannia exigua]
MSFGTTYFAPTPLGRDMFMVPKLESDPREFYVDDEKDLTAHDGAYLHVERAAPGAKQPLDRMRLNRILNGSSTEQQGYYHDHSPTMQSFHSAAGPIPVSTFPVSPVASLSPMTSSSDGSPVPAGMAPTLATMSSPLSPMTSFPTMSQPTLMFDDVMPYSYNIPQYHTQAYPFKHAGNAKPMDSSAFGTENGSNNGNNGSNNNQSHSPQTHHYSSQESDHSDSPTVLSAFPPTRAMNSLVDHSSYSMPDSPPYSSQSFYHNGQNQIPSPYSVGSHSPISNGPYFTAYGTPSNFTPTPPTTPPYGYSHTADGSRYPGGPMPMYADHHFSMPTTSQPAARANRPSGARGGRKAPYEPRAARTSADGSATGVTPAPRRFQCHECEKAFPTKGELASHSRCHLTVPAFMCGICGRPFKRRTDYVRHVRNVHEEVGRYSCAQCGERFGRLDKLKRHDKHGCGNDIKEGSDV